MFWLQKSRAKGLSLDRDGNWFSNPQLENPIPLGWMDDFQMILFKSRMSCRLFCYLNMCVKILIGCAWILFGVIKKMLLNLILCLGMWCHWCVLLRNLDDWVLEKWEPLALPIWWELIEGFLLNDNMLLYLVLMVLFYI